MCSVIADSGFPSKRTTAAFIPQEVGRNDDILCKKSGISSISQKNPPSMEIGVITRDDTAPAWEGVLERDDIATPNDTDIIPNTMNKSSML